MLFNVKVIKFVHKYAFKYAIRILLELHFNEIYFLLCYLYAFNANGESIIGAPPIQNNYDDIKSFTFSNIGHALCKVIAQFWCQFFASFLYCSLYNYWSSKTYYSKRDVTLDIEIMMSLFLTLRDYSKKFTEIFCYIEFEIRKNDNYFYCNI